MTLGPKITALRKARGMTQEELSEAVGVTRQTISKWELDVSTPDLDYLCKLCDLFGVTADYLIRPERETVETVGSADPAKATDAVETPKTAPTEAVPPPAPRSTARPISGTRFAGWCLFILGLVLTQIALLFVLFSEDSTILWLVSGILIIIGLELFLIRRRPLFTVMWTVWGICTLTLTAATGTLYAPAAVFLHLSQGLDDIVLSWAVILSALWVFYTAFCLGATVGVIRKGLRSRK